MSPPTRNGGPRARTAVANTELETNEQTQPTARTDTAVAFGEYHPPTGRRHLGVVIVRRCPACAHLHLHRAMSPATVDGTARTGSCGTTYRLRVLPAQRLGGVA